MADKNLQDKVVEALDLLPETGTVDFEAYKAQLVEADPIGWQGTLQYMMKHAMTSRKVQVVGGVVSVLLGKKA